MNFGVIFQYFSSGILYFLAAAALSLILTRILITILPVLNFVDIPHGRHQHDHAVPRGGGIAIIFSFLTIMGIHFALQPGEFNFSASPLLVQFLIPAVAITILGIVDDRYELPSLVKLIVHILIGCYFYFTGAKIDSFLSFTFPWWIALPVTVCWVIGIINAFNLIDGMDGVAAGLAMIAAFSIAFWLAFSGEHVSLIISLIIFSGACLGFLHFNFSPAKIFMGDTGSMFIGMFFAYFSIISSAKAATLTSLLVPVLAMGIPLFDVALAISRRIYRRYILHDKTVGIMTGDHDHLHHRIQQQMQNTRKSAICLYALAVLLVLGAMGAALLDNVLQTLSFAILLIVLFVVVRFATIEFFDAATLISKGIGRPHKKYLITAVHPVVDVVILLVSYFAVAALYSKDLFFSLRDIRPLLCCIAPFTIVLSISGVYHTYWLRTNIARFNKLVQMLIISDVVGLGLLLGLFLYQNGVDQAKLLHMEQFYITYALVGCALILVERMMLHYAESFWFQSLAIYLTNAKTPLPRTLLYGGGLYCRMFLISQHNACRGGKPSRHILGIIDDNTSLRHLNIFGMNVLGNSDELDKLLEKYHFTEIIITLRAITPEIRAKLIDFGKKHHIRVQEFHCQLEMHADAEI